MTEKQHSHVSVTTHSLTDTGHRRSNQEDSLGYVNIPPGEKTLALHRGHLYVVADGVGGAKGGEIASSIAVQSIIENYYTVPGTSVESALKNAILRAHGQVRAASQKRKLHKMRTTVVCAVICENTLTVAHLGDSRAYLLRTGKLKRVTNDHSVVQELVDAQELSQEEASYHPDKHVITRALGTFAAIEVEVNTFTILANDKVLLCSDGLHDELSLEEIQSVFATHANPTDVCCALIEEANLAGGKDNIGVIVTHVEAINSAPAFRAYPHLPPTEFSSIKPFSHMKLAYVEAEEVVKQNPSWSVLAVTTIIFVAILILQTLWFQSAYDSSNVNSAQPPSTINTPDEPLIIPTEASIDSIKTPQPTHKKVELPPDDFWLWVALLIFSFSLTVIFGRFLSKRSKRDAPPPPDPPNEESMDEGQYVERLIDNLSFGHLIAEGCMAKVWLAVDQRSGQKVVVKFPRIHSTRISQENIKFRFEAEITHHRNMNHANIVQFLEAGECIHPHSGRETAYLIQEFVNGRTIYQLLLKQDFRPLDPYVISNIVDQIVEVLKYMHRQKVIHRDITWKNIMLDHTGQVHLIDFGNATEFNSDMTGERGLPAVGTPFFHAPLDLIGNAPARDFYSLAMLIYVMSAGKPIFGLSERDVERDMRHLYQNLNGMPKSVRKALEWRLGGDFKDQGSTMIRKKYFPTVRDIMIEAIEQGVNSNQHQNKSQEQSTRR